MAKIYYDNDANQDLLNGKTVAIIGYGIQGRGQALFHVAAKHRAVGGTVEDHRGFRNHTRAP